MRAPPRPPDEAARQGALLEYRILDTEGERVFDEVAELAAAICGTELGFITLIDGERQWFKAEFGTPERVRQTPRDQSICGHAILERELFEVPDTREDVRFADNPGLANIRFYGGRQLVAPSGHAIGMLCVADGQPNHLSAAQRKALSHLADLVMALLESRKREFHMHWLGTLLDAIDDEILIIDPNGFRYLYANAGARRALGYTASELALMSPNDVNDSVDGTSFAALTKRVLAGEDVRFSGQRRRKDGATYPFECRWHLSTAGPEPLVISVVHDVTERRRLEAEIARRNRELADAYAEIRRDLDVARTMQMAHLPEPAAFGRMRLDWLFEPSAFVGGDVIDFFPISERHVGVYVADIAGHGIASAMVAFSVQHHVRVSSQEVGSHLIETGASLEEAAASVMAECNVRLAQKRDTDLYVTMAFAIVDIESGEAAIVRAGHPPPLLLRAGSHEPLGKDNVPLGILEREQFATQAVQLRAGDRLLLYSDGVVEARGSQGRAFGTERLLEGARRTGAQSLGNALRLLHADLRAWVPQSGFEDDVAVLALEMR